MCFFVRERRKGRRRRGERGGMDGWMDVIQAPAAFSCALSLGANTKVEEKNQGNVRTSFPVVPVTCRKEADNLVKLNIMSESRGI